MKNSPVNGMVYFPTAAHFRRVWKHPKRVITPQQASWVHYMLMLWGNDMRGDGAPCVKVNVIGRLMVRSKWSQPKQEEIERVVHWLYSEDGGGYRGEELFRKARDIVIPKSSLSSIIALAKESDDAAFVERVMVKLFRRDSPVRDVAIKRYCDRKLTQNVARDMSVSTGADIQLCRKRVQWCEDVLDAEFFYAMQREMEKEIPLIAA
ncbi:TPA: hypothetical protein QEG37_002017 [Pluralibacter gergoviae]|nr:hypothetical protein [Pluralibacter gergoviae]HDS1241440.1 hypothetical protein [Pluralibacter gergoviae]HDS1248961.1 hypothetical protein [Pluralibacter gergoviae]HDS1254153.1 hypothetical protein [Pluralibacter gergoviae]HDS1257626.1 hypothetical protein [Pluralibacter gergoviae]